MTPDDATALRNLAAGKKCVVELGTFMGESAEIIMSAMDPEGHLYMIDTFNADSGGDEIERYSRSAQLGAVFSRLKPYEGRFTVIVGRIENVSPIIGSQQFDMVFIDAAHDYESTKRDIEIWGTGLRPGGILSGHDYDKPSSQCDQSRLMEFSHEDYNDADGCHYGVIRAVDELIGEDRVETLGRVWWVAV